jgi:hypothetical protein
VYAETLMRVRLVVSVLVLLLSGADSGAALFCASSCTSSTHMKGTASRHREMESQPNATHASQSAPHHGTPCADCPPATGNNLNQRSDCNSLFKIQALTESSLSLNAPTGVARALANRPADGFALGSDGQQYFLFGAFSTTRDSAPPSLPLRI